MDFHALPRPLTRLFFFSGLATFPWILRPVLAGFGIGALTYQTELQPDIQFLLLNVSLFLAFWTVYFLSPTVPWARCQSLRTLLRDQTIHRGGSSNVGENDEEHRRTQRTQALLTSQAVFIAVALILIDLLLSVRSTLGVAVASVPVEVQRLLIDLGLFAAVLSFVALLVAFDAVDTSMNEFTGDYVNGLVPYFGRWASRVKYQGLILVYLALVLLLSAVIPLLGAVGAILLPFVGYTYWFIDASSPLQSRREAKLYRGFVVALNALLGALILAGT